MSKTFYITTTLPYVNSEPHIGFAMEFIRADIIARSKKLQGFEVFFNTGTDEHGQKIFDNAQKAGIPVEVYVGANSDLFRFLLTDLLNIFPDVHFIRTTEERHVKAAQEFWKMCEEAGDIYKKNYKIKYCIGCELEKQDSELENGRCVLHPDKELEIREEENYFFRFSKYQKPLLDLYEKNPQFVIPDTRFNEIKSFVERGLEDFSISRLASKMSWGVPVPGDPEHVMYVWFDALVNYISTLGWPEKTEDYEKFWANGTPTQYAGKDNLRQQSAMWQAMLMSAGLSPTHTIVINGFINSGGQKMSKSLGNVVAPGEIISEYGTDSLRYFLAREISTFEDGDFTMERFKDAYNGNLANGLGNLVSRVMKMAEDNLDAPVHIHSHADEIFFGFLNTFEIGRACDYIWLQIGLLDQHIQETAPFKVVKTDKEMGKKMIEGLVAKLYAIAEMLEPVLPDTSAKIKDLIAKNKSPEAPLFLRKD